VLSLSGLKWWTQAGGGAGPRMRSSRSCLRACELRVRYQRRLVIVVAHAGKTTRGSVLKQLEFSGGACPGELDGGSPSKNLRHSRIEAAGLEQD
jgi:hypothetical protein